MTASPHPGFYAIDAAVFWFVCGLGLNEAVAYLLIACGTQRDNATSTWAVQSVERRGGLSRSAARNALERLVEAGVLQSLNTKPGDPTSARFRLRDRQEVPLSKVPSFEKGRERIWLPNTLIQGTGRERPPIQTLRQMQNVAFLRFIVLLYLEQNLPEMGGIDRRSIWQNYDCEIVGERAQFNVLAYRSADYDFDLARTALYLRGVTDTNVSPLELIPTWLHKATRLGLIEWIPHLFESTEPTGEYIHSLEWRRSGSERIHLIGMAAHKACEDAVTGEVWHKTRRERRRLTPVYAHIEKAAVIGIARLRYRPHTAATAAWIARQQEDAAMYGKFFLEAAQDDSLSELAAG